MSSNSDNDNISVSSSSEVSTSQSEASSVVSNLGIVQKNELVPIEQVNAEEIRENYPVLPEEKAIIEFKKITNKWLGTIDTSSNILDVYEFGMRNFGLLGRQLSMEILKQEYEKNVYQVLSLFAYFKKNNLIKKKDPDTNIEYYTIFNKVLEVIYYTEQAIRGGLRMRLVLDPTYDSTMNDDIGLFKFEGYDISENSPYQNLILYLLRKLYENQYRRYGQYVYEMHFKEDGQFTYSWKEKKTIKEFVHGMTKKELNYAQWHNATKNKSNIKDSIDYLENCNSAEFPVLIKDRHVFSFRNGVYITKSINEKTGKYQDYWFEYGTKPALPSSVVACKHFDLEFDNHPEVEQEDWYSIPTPCFQQILDYQYEGLDDHEQICKWMYIFIGKLLYEIKELERWQILPYLNGLAGCGKSTICDVIRNFFESKDVGIIENTIEEKFGLAPISGKYIFLAPEIKKNFTLDQALFQKVVSGEEVCLPQKNKDPVQIIWCMPGFMASNEAPGFMDSAGSISRRLVVFKFTRIVTPDVVDPDLMIKLKLETGALLKKCNMAYLNTVNNKGSSDIWKILPKYFHETREALGRETNPLKSFLGSGRVIFGKEIYCKERQFKEAFKEYCQENNMGKVRWTEGLYEEPFAMYGAKHRIRIKIQKQVKKKWPRDSNRMSHGTFINGIDIAPRQNDIEIQEDM